MHDVIPIVFKKVLWIFAAWIGSVVWIYSASVVVVVVVYDDRSNFFQRVVPIISAISQSGKRILKQQQQQLEEQPNTHQQQRLLFIITSMHEYDTGKRDTIVNYDRFSNTIVPVLRESVTSILNTQNYQVDVYLITHYRISESRYRQVWDALAGTGGIVGLEIWDDATPIGYALENGESFVRIEPISRGLARQHRYVIKDKFLYYDVFLNFEDDMLITGAHVDHYLQLTTQLQHLRNQAPNVLPESIASQIHHVWQAEEIYYGPMTSKALARTVPGFIRVEVPLEQFEPAPLKKFEKAIPVDFRYDDDAFHSPGTTTNKASIDPTICCQVSSATVNDHIPLLKPNSDLLFWETSIEALGVRVLPDINATWVLLLAGNNNEIWDDPNFVVGDYWSGRAGYFGKNYPRPDRRRGKYVNNQGGWMATRSQIFEWHWRWCRGGLLPPYNLPFYRFDGLDLRTVEYWSGGIQLVGVNGCNLQRIVSLDADGFSRHLLYHTSNNKQKSKRVRRQFNGHTVNEFWGQLNTIRKHAIREMQQQQRQPQPLQQQN